MSTPTLPLPPQHSDWPDAAGARRTGIATGLASQLVRFGAIGVASTLAYLALYVLLRGALGAQPANLLALLATTVANTTANRRLTFGLSGRAGAGRAQVEGLLVFGLGLALTSGALAALPAVTVHPGRRLELTVLVAANATATVLRFLLLRSWVFAPHRRSGVGGNQDRELQPAAGVHRDGRQRGQRAAGQRQPETEHEQAFDLRTARTGAAGQPEREASVRRGVSHRGRQQGEQVGGLRAEGTAQQDIQRQVGQRTGDADGAEPHQLVGQPGRDPCPAGSGGVRPVGAMRRQRECRCAHDDDCRRRNCPAVVPILCRCCALQRTPRLPDVPRRCPGCSGVARRKWSVRAGW